MMGVSKTSDDIQIKIKMTNPSQEPPASSKALNQDLNDMNILCTFKTKMETQNLKHCCVKDQRPYQNHDLDFEPRLGISRVLQSPKS